MLEIPLAEMSKEPLDEEAAAVKAEEEAAAKKAEEEAMARARAGLRWAPGIPGSLSRTIAGQRNSSAEQWDDPVTEW